MLRANGSAFVAGIDVDDAALAREEVDEPRRDGAARLGIRSVDLGQDRLADRWSGRRLEDAQRRAVAARDRLQARAQPAYEECRLRCGACLSARDSRECRLDLRRVAEDGALEEAREIRYRFKAGENLVVGDLGSEARVRRRRSRRCASSAPPCSSGGVSMLTRNVVSLARGSIRNCTSVNAGSASATTNAMPRATSRRVPAFAVLEQRAPARAKRAVPSRGCACVGFESLIAQEAIRRPRRDRERDAERGEHRDRDVERDRPHVRAHHSGHEQHRQKRQYDGQRRERGRASDFAHRADRRLDFRRIGFGRVMAMDVFHQHDRVVDQESEGKNQREERDAVDASGAPAFRRRG